LDAWIQYQAKMKRSSDTKYDVKFNGKWRPKLTSHQRRLKLKETSWPRVARSCLGAQPHRANLLPMKLEKSSFARYEDPWILVGFQAVWWSGIRGNGCQ